MRPDRSSSTDDIERAWRSISSSEARGVGERADFLLGRRIGPCWIARSRAGYASLVIPLSVGSNASSLVSSGIRCIAANGVQFGVGRKVWSEPAAVVECTDSSLILPFWVVAADLIDRIGSVDAVPTWPAVASIVLEWQALFRSRPRLGLEEELGLWGELWVLSQSRDPDVWVAGWRGPERDHTDFLLKSTGVEVKTSRHRLAHWVSLSQLSEATGGLPGYLVSIFAKEDPVDGSSVANLVRDLLGRLQDRAVFAKKLAEAGCPLPKAPEYERRFLALERPWWFETAAVPRIRAWDPGIDQVRYRVDLDDRAALGDKQVTQLERRLLGRRIPFIESWKL